MKYNILTVINEGYATFGKLFINSLIENVNLINVEKIYVYDTGLSPETIAYFNYFPKVVVVDTGSNFTSSGIHDKGWADNTYSKTTYLLDVLEKSNLATPEEIKRKQEQSENNWVDLRATYHTKKAV